MTPIEEELTDVLEDFYAVLKKHESELEGLLKGNDELQGVLYELYHMCERYYR